MKIILSLIILLLISKIKNEILHIPFKTLEYNPSSNNNLNALSEIDSIILSLIHNDIYISFTLGDPPQQINSFLKLEEFPFFISGKDIKNNQYDETKSSSYKSEKYPHAFLEGLERIKWGLVSNDTLILNIKDNNNKKMNEFNFILVTESRTDSSSNIGLMIPNEYSSIPDISFIYQLKKQKIIEDYSFLINYTDPERGEGEFIIGNPPHKFNKKYSEKFYKTSYAINKPNFMMYGLNFDSIISGKDNIGGTMQCKFLSDFGMIVGSIKYYDYIYKNFFEKKILEKICFKGNITANIEWREGEKSYVFFYCNKNKKNILENIESIKFIHKEMNYSFEFNYNELFFEKKDFLIFKIIFNLKSNFYWIFGKPWFTKYQMIFDQDKKTIGHYCYIKDNNDDENNDNDNINKINWILLGIIGVLVLVIIFFGIWMVNYYKNSRKKRINEIKDEFDYTQENENNDNKKSLINESLGIND